MPTPSTAGYALAAAFVLLPDAALAQNATTAGVAVAPFPTLNHITMEWPISGDADADGVVNVRYREQGSAVWRDSIALIRVPAGSNAGFSWSNRHSGSLFGLMPATSYEIELSLVDPDGGSAQQTLTATTRAVPRAMPDAPRRPATPATLSSVLASAQPGDIIELGAGTYPGFTLNRDGEADQPLVLRGTPGAVIDGELGLFSRRHIHLERLTVNGRIRFNGSQNIAITRCTVNASPTLFNGDGIVALTRAENAYIADNVVNGSSTWIESAMGASGNNRGEGIAVTGPGHVVMHNRVRGFRDNLSLLEDAAAIEQFSIDFLGNELSEGLDDAVEADFCAHNCRVVGNRVTNAFVAFSSQPGLGGPTWFVRNAAYNVAHVAFKLYRTSVGDVLIHNTVVKAGDGLGIYTGVPVARLITRNNLFLGGPGGVINGFGNGSGRVIDIATLTLAGSSLNFDAFGAVGVAFGGRLGSVSFASLAELRSLTTQTDATQIVGGTGVFAGAPTFPADPLQQFIAQDLRLAATANVIDSAIPLPGINDGFAGSRPDPGAYESGAALPLYGPRPEPPDGDTLFADGFE